MTLPALLLLIVAATLLIARGHTRSSLALYATTLVIFYAIACGPIPRFLLGHLQAGFDTQVTQWSAHNDIVLLGAGVQRTERGVELPIFSYGRLVSAFSVYRDCKAQAVECHIISSGGDIGNYGRSEADLYRASLLQLGAVADDLIDEDRSVNTWQNAQFTAPILASHAGSKVVLVTSGLHLKRSALYFSHFGVLAEPVRGDYGMPPASWLPSSYHVLLMDLAIHEYLGVLRYHVYNLFGWNVQAAKAESL